MAKRSKAFRWGPHIDASASPRPHVRLKAGRAGGPALAPEIRGRDSVANIFRGRARVAQLALVDGDSGLVFAPGGQLRVVVEFVLENGRIVEINMIADAERIAALDLEF
jgi:RNA polymerase sigma-70 factor (ECF subfamily)